MPHVLRGPFVRRASSVACIRVLRSADGTIVHEVPVGVHRGALAVAGRCAVWAAVGDPFELTVFDLQTGSIRYLPTGSKDPVTAVAALSERRVISAEDGTFKVWNLDSGENERSLTLEYWEPRQLAALDEVRVLVVTERSERPRLLNLETGTSSNLGWWDVGHQAAVTAVGALDVRYAVSAARDRTLIVWDVEKEEAPTLLVMDSPLIELDCQRDSGQIATVDTAGNVNLLRFRQRSTQDCAEPRGDLVPPAEIAREVANEQEKTSVVRTSETVKTGAPAPPRQQQPSIVLKPPPLEVAPPPVATLPAFPAPPPDPHRPLPWLLADAPKLRLDRVRKELHCKIVYYGPGLSGKTANVQYIYNKTPPEAQGKMISLVGTHDITLYFDYLCLRLGRVKEFETLLHLYTVPGQVFYNAVARLILTGTDGIIFVADSQEERLESNIESIRSLEQNLKEYSLDLASLPYVLQLNKRDLPNSLPVDELYRVLNYKREPTFEAMATEGHGVFAALKAVTRQIFAALRRGWELGQQYVPGGGRLSE